MGRGEQIRGAPSDGIKCVVCMCGRVGGVSVCAACVGEWIRSGYEAMSCGVHIFLSVLRVGGCGFGTPYPPPLDPVGLDFPC